MAEQETNRTQKKRILTALEKFLARVAMDARIQKPLEKPSKKELIKNCLEMIITCKGMITIANQVAKRRPESSELCSEVVVGNRELIAIYTKEIRSISSGKH